MQSFERLRWQCRRGVVELDILLLRFLENSFLQANHEVQARFAELLTWEDDELLAVLVAGKEPEIQGFGALIGRIRGSDSRILDDNVTITTIIKRI